MSYDPINLVGTVGFPICAFLLVYLDLRRKIEELTIAVNTLAKRIEQSGIQKGT